MNKGDIICIKYLNNELKVRFIDLEKGLQDKRIYTGSYKGGKISFCDNDIIKIIPRLFQGYSNNRFQIY